MSDYISRESVLNTIEDMDKTLDTDRTVEEYKALLIECIKVLPSSSNIAQWLLTKEHTEDNILKQEFQCTHCGFTLTVFDGHITQYKYCPSCCARMKFIKIPKFGFNLYQN